jgi:hypothetical protein
MVTGRGANAKDVFAELCDQDRWENGHSYSGGIGMKDSFVLIGTVQTREAARVVADRLIDEADPRIDDKYGPAGCIEVVEPTIVDAPEAREGSTAALVFAACVRSQRRALDTKTLAMRTGKSQCAVNRYASKLVASGHLVKDGKGFKVATRKGSAPAGVRTFVFFGWASC